MKSRKKEVLLWAFLLIVLFSAGWFRGYRPEINWRSFFGEQPPLVILAPEEAWLNQDLAKLLGEILERPVVLEQIDDFTEFEARLIPQDTAPLVWMSANWARAFHAQGLLSDFDRLNKVIRDKVSPDFQFAEAPVPVFLPLMWARQSELTRIEGFALPSGGRERADALKLMRRLLRDENSIEFARKAPVATTLRALDNADLPLEKKALFLRDQNFAPERPGGPETIDGSPGR